MRIEKTYGCDNSGNYVGYFQIMPENDDDIFTIGRLSTKLELFEKKYTNDTVFPEPAKIDYLEIPEMKFISFIINAAWNV